MPWLLRLIPSYVLLERQVSDQRDEIRDLRDELRTTRAELSDALRRTADVFSRQVTGSNVFRMASNEPQADVVPAHMVAAGIPTRRMRVVEQTKKFWQAVDPEANKMSLEEMMAEAESERHTG